MLGEEEEGREMRRGEKLELGGKKGKKENEGKWECELIKDIVQSQAKERDKQRKKTEIERGRERKKQQQKDLDETTIL